MKYTQNGDYVLNSLVLVKDDNEIDLSQSFGDVSLYESIFNHFMTATVTVLDSFDLKNQLPIDGEERIVIDFETTSSDNPIHFEGVLYRIDEDAGTDQSKGLILYFASQSALMNQRTFEQGGYHGTTSDIAKRVFQKLDTGNKPFEVEQTIRIDNYVFPTVRPVEAIDFLCTESISNTQNVGYLFYEGKDAFHFRSLQSMFQQEAEYAYLHGYGGVYESPDNAIVEKFNSYQAFDELEPIQFMDKVQNGYYGSDYGYFDIKSKKMIHYRESYSDNFDPDKSLAQYPNRQNHPNSQYNDRRVMRYHSGIVGLVNIHQRIRQVINSLDNYRAMFSVFGDSSVGVGNVCHAVIPIRGSSNLEEPTNFYTGKFLIAEIKHRITPDKYRQTMTVVKDAYEESADDRST